MLSCRILLYLRALKLVKLLSEVEAEDRLASNLVTLSSAEVSIVLFLRVNICISLKVSQKYQTLGFYLDFPRIDPGYRHRLDHQ